MLVCLKFNVCLSMLMCTCALSTWEAKTEGLLSSRPGWSPKSQKKVEKKSSFNEILVFINKYRKLLTSVFLFI